MLCSRLCRGRCRRHYLIPAIVFGVIKMNVSHAKKASKQVRSPICALEHTLQLVVSYAGRLVPDMDIGGIHSQSWRQAMIVIFPNFPDRLSVSLNNMPNKILG